MATIAPKGRSYYYDSNGDPLSGGKVYTYEAGTTTPKATFTTQDESTANANPVILDAAGSANIWLGDGGYKFVVTNSADVELFTTDNLGGGSSAAFGSNVNTLTSNTPITDLYANSINICTGAITLSLLAASSAGEGFYFTVQNNSGGNVVIDPDGSETINGSATLTLSDGQSAITVCNGTTWFSVLETFVLEDDAVTTAKIIDNAVTTPKIANTAVTLAKLNSDVVIDEDDMATDSATRPPSQQSVKAYVDAVEAQVIGVGQSWSDVSGSRIEGTEYTNSTGKPIMVAISCFNATSNPAFYIDSLEVWRGQGNRTSLSFIIPDGSTYELDSVGGGAITINNWVELR